MINKWRRADFSDKHEKWKESRKRRQTVRFYFLLEISRTMTYLTPIRQAGMGRGQGCWVLGAGCRVLVGGGTEAGHANIAEEGWAYKRIYNWKCQRSTPVSETTEISLIPALNSGGGGIFFLYSRIPGLLKVIFHLWLLGRSIDIPSTLRSINVAQIFSFRMS